MSLANSFSRLTTYFKRYGVRATAGRVTQSVIRSLFCNRMVLFCFDFEEELPKPAEGPVTFRVEEKKHEDEICATNLNEFVSFWNPKLAQQEMGHRFTRGASLWLLKVDGKLAGYGWTLRGGSIEPHYFLLGHDDVHLFDYYVAPSYRGRGLNPQLVNHVLRNLAKDGCRWAFIEVAEWNHAQLSSLRKTPFRRLGYDKKFCWDMRRPRAQSQPVSFPS